MNKMKNPNRADVIKFVLSMNYTLEKSTIISDLYMEGDRNVDVYAFPFSRDEILKQIAEEELWWNEDYDRWYDDPVDIIEWEEEDWEQYCKRNDLNHEGDIDGS
jgi:hypothetical protein